MNELPADVGSALAKLRQAARVTQSDVAPKVRVDQSRISRIESGEVVPSASETRSFLKALDTEEARAFLRYLEREWKFVSRPPQDHPQIDALWSGDQQLRRLAEFEETKDVPGPLRAEIAMHRESILRAAHYLTSLNHDVAFVGDIGVGKTTALCFIGDLVLSGTGAALGKVALEAGGGGTTVCEVQVKKGPQFGIVIQPEAEAEIYTMVGELCAGLKAAGPEDGGAPAEGKKGVSRELDRALRNMAGLARVTERAPDGKRLTRDLAAELAKTVGSVEELRSEFSSRLRLWERTTRELWYEESPKASPLKWVRDTFTSINNGRLPGVSLPRRLDVLVPEPLLKDSSFLLAFIDTKGVDDTAIRPDLKLRLDDPRTLTILCSRFNSAPDTTMQRFIEHTIQTGSERVLSERVLLLVLPRPDEARAMKDDAGQLPDIDADGYQLKSDQVEATLRRIGADGMPVVFFNVTSDEPADIADALLARIRRMRQIQVERLESLANTVHKLIKNHEVAAAEAVRADVLKQLSIFVKRHGGLGDRLRPVHHDLIAAVETLNARTVWATTRRQGRWQNLDVYYYLGAGAAADAKRRVRPIFQELQGILGNMLEDPDFESAYEFIGEVRTNAEEWQKEFFETVRRAGQETFRPGLEDATQLWSDCENRWGSGGVYRPFVAEQMREWFEGQVKLHKALEAKIRLAWRSEVLRPLRELCNESVTETEGC